MKKLFSEQKFSARKLISVGVAADAMVMYAMLFGAPTDARAECFLFWGSTLQQYCDQYGSFDCSRTCGSGQVQVFVPWNGSDCECFCCFNS
jgi:hypothetical protein